MNQRADFAIRIDERDKSIVYIKIAMFLFSFIFSEC